LIPWVLRQADLEEIRLLLEHPSPDGWVGVPCCGRDLAELCRRVHSAWVAQRPGCGGLVSRLVLCDAGGEAFATISSARAVGAPEPMAWRVVLLLAVLAGGRTEEAAWAAK
jgi:putative heme degradation protein